MNVVSAIAQQTVVMKLMWGCQVILGETVATESLAPTAVVK